MNITKKDYVLITPSENKILARIRDGRLIWSAMPVSEATQTEANAWKEFSTAQAAEAHFGQQTEPPKAPVSLLDLFKNAKMQMSTSENE